MARRGRPRNQPRRNADGGNDGDQRDPRDIEIERLQQRVRELEIEQEVDDEETESDPNVWGEEEENSFGKPQRNNHNMSHDDPLRSFGVRTDLPDFEGRAQPDDFIDWLSTRDGQELQVPGTGTGIGGNRRFRNWNWSDRVRFQIRKFGIWSDRFRFQIRKFWDLVPAGQTHVKEPTLFGKGRVTTRAHLLRTTAASILDNVIELRLPHHSTSLTRAYEDGVVILVNPPPAKPRQITG
ncbi:hypothetical protein LXL04_039528 [Taraxacum kok-saghyz]